MPILEVQGWSSTTAGARSSTACRSRSTPARSSACSGPNGAGKTTSFRMTTGQIAPYDGQVVFNGQDVTAPADVPPGPARHGLPVAGTERLPQAHRRAEHPRRARNAAASRGPRPAAAPLASAGTGPRRRIEQFGLTHVRKNKAARCSGGEKRRLEIARCLVCEPNLILLDEPFAGVDPLTKADIRQIVRELVRDRTSASC